MKKILKLCVFVLVIGMAVGAANAQTVATIALDSLQFEQADSTAQTAESTEEISATASELLKQKLLATRKFKILDYSSATELLAAQGLSVTDVTESESEDTVSADGIDYVLSAVVTNFDAQEEAPESAKVEFILRPTVSFLNEVKSSVMVSADNSQDSTSALDSLTSSLVTEVVANIFPVRVVGISEDGVLSLNYGAGLLRRGDMLEVFAPINKPSNGSVEPGPVKGSAIAKIEITETNKKFALAKIVESSNQIERGFKAKPI